MTFRDRGTDAMAAGISAVFGRDPIETLDLNCLDAATRLIQIWVLGVDTCNMDFKIRKVANTHASSPGMTHLGLGDMVQVQDNFLAACKKQSLKWTCVMWKFHVIDGVQSSFIHNGALAFTDESTTRWIITKKLTPEHNALLSLGLDLKTALEDEGEEAGHAFFCLLTYLGYSPKYVRYFGFGKPLNCSFPAKALDDAAKPGKRSGFSQIDATNFEPKLSKQALKMLDRIIAKTPMSAQKVKEHQQQNGGAQALYKKVFSASDLCMPPDCRLDQCSWCQASAADKGVQRLMKCSRCQVALYCSKTCQKDHWKASHKTLCQSVL